MNINMGIIDRALRAVLSFSGLALVIFDIITGIAAVITLVVAGIFLLTALIGFCPLYKMLHISTVAKS